MSHSAQRTLTSSGWASASKLCCRLGGAQVVGLAYPAFLSANMRSPLGIDDSTRPLRDQLEQRAKISSSTPLVCARCIQSEAVLQHMALDRNFFNNAAPSQRSLPL